MGTDGTDTTNNGLIGKLFDDIVKALLGDNPVLAVITMASIIVSIVAGLIGVVQFALIIISWVKKEKKSVIVEHAGKMLVAFGICALVAVAAAGIISYASANYGK